MKNEERQGRELAPLEEGEYPVKIITQTGEIDWDVTAEEDWELIFKLVKKQVEKGAEIGRSFLGYRRRL